MAKQPNNAIVSSIPLPFKGINRTFGRSTQPEGTTWDALNVLPFDRQGRQRIAQRAGAGRLFDDIEGLTVDAGSNTTHIVDAQLGTDGYQEIEIFGKVLFAANTTTVALRGESMTITSYDAETHTITLDSALPATPVVGDTYKIERLLNDSTRNVKLLEQLTWINSPFDNVPDQELLSVDFTTVPGNGNNLYNVGGAGTTWRTFGGVGAAAVFSSGLIDNTRFIGLTDRMIADSSSTTNTDHAAAVYVASLSVGASYSVTLDFAVDNNSETVTTRTVAVHARIQLSVVGTGAPTSVAAVYNETASSLTIQTWAGSGTTIATNLSVPDVTDGARHTLELRVNGNLFSAWIDGTKYLEATTTHSAGETGTGFEVQTISFDGTNNGGLYGFEVFSTTPAGSIAREYLVAVSGDSIYAGSIDTGLARSINGDEVLSSAYGRPEATSFENNMYFVDGSDDIRVLDAVTNTVTILTASAGAAPEKCTVAATWRGRLVLAAPVDGPHNFFFSRQGDPEDWDYAETDPAAAFAGNASVAGKIGQPITALMPHSDDLLVIGCTRSLFIVRGDPADGGTIDQVSDYVGVYGARSWTQDNTGNIYFVGPGGLYRLNAMESNPVNVSESIYNQFFADLNPGTHYIDLVWDRERFGCWIFVTRVADGTSTHLFYDQRQGGFWPIRFSNELGPMSALVFFDQDPTVRKLLIGGRDGRIRQLSDNARRDDIEKTISAYIFVGPFQPNPPFGDTILSRVNLDQGEVKSGDSVSVWNVHMHVRGGKTAYSVTEGTALQDASYNFTEDLRSLTRVIRVRGGWFSFYFENSNDGDYFSIDKLTAVFVRAGDQR